MESLNVVYRYQNTSLTNDLVELLFMYSQKEVIPSSEIVKEFEQLLDPQNPSLVFEHKDVFEQFIQKVMESMRVNSSKILTVDDYNLGLSNISQMSEVDSIFEKYGTEIKISEEPASDKGFFGKFFK